MRGIRGTLFIRGTLLSFNIISRFSIFISLVSYVYFGNVFTARKVFIVTSYFNFLYSSVLHFWPLAVSAIAEVFISIQRIEEFLLLPENKESLMMRQKRNQNVNIEKSDFEINPNRVVKNEKLWKNEKEALLQIENTKNYEKTVVNGNEKPKGIVFKNVTASWPTDDSSDSCTGE